MCVIFFKKKKLKTSKLEKAIYDEDNAKINKLSTWKEFARKTLIHKQKTLNFLNDFKNKKIVGFGSSARSQTYLNFCGITNKDIIAIIDNNSLKHNLFTPGSSIPIIDFDEGMKIDPDIIFILAWNFKDEIIKECINKGFNGNFFIPFPQYPYMN